jgi:hypothetical protein
MNFGIIFSNLGLLDLNTEFKSINRILLVSLICKADFKGTKLNKNHIFAQTFRKYVKTRFTTEVITETISIADSDNQTAGTSYLGIGTKNQEGAGRKSGIG